MMCWSTPAQAVSSLPTVCSYPPTLPIIGPTGITLSPTWAAAFTTPFAISTTLHLAGVFPQTGDNPFSGCTQAGATQNNCNNWATSSPTTYYQFGSQDCTSPTTCPSPNGWFASNPAQTYWCGQFTSAYFCMGVQPATTKSIVMLATPIGYTPGTSAISTRAQTNQICANLANANNINYDAAFAYLAYSTADAPINFPFNMNFDGGTTPVYGAGGLLIASNYNLLFGTVCCPGSATLVNNPYAAGANPGGTYNANILTGTLSTGAFASGYTCSGSGNAYSSGSGNAQTGVGNRADAGWTAYVTSNGCNNAYQFYCMFLQGPPQPRIVMYTASPSLYNGNIGNRAAANAICKTYAYSAGYYCQSTPANLCYNGDSVNQFYDTYAIVSGTPIVGPTNYPIGTFSPTGIFSNTPTSLTNTLVTAGVMTSATNGIASGCTQTGSYGGAGSACSTDWTSTGGTCIYGEGNVNNGNWLNTYSYSCSSGLFWLHCYCVQN